jgi:hypothetical protein
MFKSSGTFFSRKKALSLGIRKVYNEFHIVVVVVEVLDFVAVWICRSIQTFRRNLQIYKTQNFNIIMIMAVRTSNIIDFHKRGKY